MADRAYLSRNNICGTFCEVEQNIIYRGFRWDLQEMAITLCRMKGESVMASLGKFDRGQNVGPWEREWKPPSRHGIDMLLFLFAELRTMHLLSGHGRRQGSLHGSDSTDDVAHGGAGDGSPLFPDTHQGWRYIFSRNGSV